jgi:hypothetical protein
MARQPKEPENVVEVDGETRLGFCSLERPDPASLVFIACAACARVVSLADSVSSVTGRRVCWDCGLLSLGGLRP